MKTVGPGVVTGIADDDPSGIATYAQTGAMFGLQQLWLALYAIPFMIAVQEMCGRIGMVTGDGLAGLMRKHYPRYILVGSVSLLILANVINIGADLGAMATALHMISPFSVGISMVCITLFTAAAAVFIPYHLYVKFLKYFALSIAAYIFAAFMVKHDWHSITFATLVPHIQWNKEFFLNVTAFLGTTISPYLFFWQADEEVEEEIASGKIHAFGKGRPKLTKSDLTEMRTDTVIGMAASNIVAFFIIITASSAFHDNGVYNVATATKLADALTPLAGHYATLLFALGILGTGLLAVPVLAGSGAYALSEAFGIKAGLGKTFSQAKGFYAVLSIALLVGALLNFIQIEPITMLYYTAAINGLLAPPLLVIILFMANNKKILGDKTNSMLSNILGITITIIMSLVGIFTIASFFN